MADLAGVGLLGPVELRGPDGRSRDAGPPQQRCLLAVLAMAPGRPVAAETLLDRLWDQDPPGNARDALYTYVSRLRRVLRRAAGGYVLDLAAEEVDVHRSRALARRARAEGGERPGPPPPVTPGRCWPSWSEETSSPSTLPAASASTTCCASTPPSSPTT
ncbi:AfsR/SARP family transcriptional regulator [Streptomyces sp. 6N223]|uniref:AfsR/SARP family transcriptional regulator n=1 Tax=Streptomyces sp. 6N223 TaxID=3457412 RepID=UPI003FCF9003